ncbi:17393_t:CDS:2, partial [Cetraspora pellucida]
DLGLSDFERAGEVELVSPYDFYLAKSGRKSGDDTKFKELLSLLEKAKADKKTVFIPVNDAKSPDGGGKHWSLLVYEGTKFYHFDSAGGMNYKYVEDTVKDLLRQLGAPESHINKENKAIVKKHDILQGDDYNCGVAVIAFTERIVKNGGQNRYIERIEVEAKDELTVKKTFSELDKKKILAKARETFGEHTKGTDNYDKGGIGDIEVKNKEDEKTSTNAES